MNASPEKWLRRLCETAPGYRRWLADRGSLTRRIQQRCPAFSVRGLRQRSARIERDEAALIGLAGHARAWLREVRLYCGDTPVVFAHSVLPAACLRGVWRGLRGLGSRPLGAALFANPRIERAPLAFRKLPRQHPLYRRAAAGLPARPTHLWARRSAFRLDGKPILVTEVFLPGILALDP